MAGKEEEVASPMDRLDKTYVAFSVESSAEKTKLMIKNTNGILIDIRINYKKLDEFQVSGRSRHW